MARHVLYYRMIIDNTFSHFDEEYNDDNLGTVKTASQGGEKAN